MLETFFVKSKETWDVPTTLSYVNTIMPTKCWTPISQNHSSSDKLLYLQTSCKTSQKVSGFADKEQNLPTKNVFQGGCDAPHAPIPTALVLLLENDHKNDGN